MTNPLDAVYAWHRTGHDSMRVVERVLNKGIAGAITDKHVFYPDESEENLRRLDVAKVELGRLVVLQLVAVFERVLRDHLGELARTASLPAIRSERRFESR